MIFFDLQQFVDLPQLNKSKIVRKSRSSVLDYINKLKKDLSIRLTDLWASDLDLTDLLISKPDCVGHKFQMHHFCYKCNIEGPKRSKIGYYYAQTAENDEDIVYGYMVIYIHNFGLYEIIVLANNLLRADFYLNGAHLGCVTPKRDYSLSIWDKIAYFFGQDGKTLQRATFFDVYDNNDVFLGDIALQRHDGKFIGILDRVYLRTPQNKMIPVLVNALDKKVKLNTIGGWLWLVGGICGISRQSYPAPIILHNAKESIPPGELPFFFALSLFFRGYVHVDNEGQRKGPGPRT
jgi:hypothetical protein